MCPRAHVVAQPPRRALRRSHPTGWKARPCSFFFCNQHFIRKRESKNQREGMNTPNCPAAKKHSKPRPSPPDDEILLCPPKGGLAPYQREGVMGANMFLTLSYHTPPTLAPTPLTLPERGSCALPFSPAPGLRRFSLRGWARSFNMKMEDQLSLSV